MRSAISAIRGRHAGCQCWIDELQRGGAVPLVDVGPVGGADARRQRLGVVEQDRRRSARRRRRSASRECRPPTMRWSRDGEDVVEDRRRKALAPDFAPQRVARARASSSPGASGAVRFERAPQLRGRELLAGDGLERRARSAGRSGSASVSPAAYAWPPKRDDAGPARAWPRDRARRADGSRRSSGRSRAARRRLPRANTIAGRWKRSFSREATMPTTPWCHSGRYRHSV